MKSTLHQTYKEIEAEHWWFVGRRRLLFSTLDRLYDARPLGKNDSENDRSRILDVGCNSGVLVGHLAEKGWQAFGCDVSREAVARGTEAGIQNLSVATGDALPHPAGFFDCVLCLDVLEHIEDDAAAMAEIHRVLKPGGRLIIMVPMFEALWGVQDVAAEHWRRYSRAELQQLAAEKSWRIVYESYFNFFLFIPIAASRFIQRIIPPRRSSDFDLNNKTVNALFRRLFLFEIGLLNWIRYPFGVSLLLVLEKGTISSKYAQ